MQVCVQGSMGEGALAGMPLQLAGSRKILEFMDWGDYGAKGTFINIGSIGISIRCTIYSLAVAAFDPMPLMYLHIAHLLEAFGNREVFSVFGNH